VNKFKFLGEWPAESRAAVEPSLAGLEWLVPGWCETVWIAWASVPRDNLEAEASATTSIEYPYRWAKIVVRPGFLDESVERRRSALIHELLHVFIGPLAEYAEQMADRLMKDDAPKFHETVREELRVRHESAVQDLAYAILGRERSAVAIDPAARRHACHPWSEAVRP